MKVLHLLDSVNRGGAEAQALDVCRNAARFGLEMTLVTAGAGGSLEGDFRDTGVDYVGLERKLPVDIFLASQLRKIIKEKNIEIVHGYQAVDGLHLYLATLGLSSVRKVLSFQGFIADRKNSISSKFLIPRMDANVAVSNGLRNWLADVGGLNTRDFHIIYNGADPLRMRPTGKSLRHELALPDDSLLIGMVGNFYRDPRKDQLTVCRALPKVFERFENAHCVFAGRIEEGADDKQVACLNFCIENGIADRVHFLGSRSDIPDVLAALDVFVFSSLHEGLPLAVSEAMLAGVPMIVSNIEPLLEATADGEYAEVFPVGDDKTLAEKMEDLLGNPAGRSELAERAKAFALDNFSIDAHLRELLRLYEALN